MAQSQHVQHLKMKPIKLGGKASRVGSGKSFGVAYAAAEGFMGTANAAMSTTGVTNPTASSVLSAAFGGVQAGMGAMGTSSMASGMGMSTGGVSGLGIPGMESVSGIPGSSGDAVIPGTEGFTQWDLVNTMNQNNLQLLELQAMMQSNLQGWNTRSNILNADHRAKMAMIEKLSPR